MDIFHCHFLKTIGPYVSENGSASYTWKKGSLYFRSPFTTNLRPCTSWRLKTYTTVQLRQIFQKYTTSPSFWVPRHHLSHTYETQLGGENKYLGADKFLARPKSQQATATEDFDFVNPIYNHNWRNISAIYIYNKTSIKRNILTIKQNTGVLISP